MPELSDQELKKLRLSLAAVDQALEGIAFLDEQTKLLYVNQAFANMHGYQPAELIGKTIYLLHNDEQKAQVEAVIERVKTVGRFSGLIRRIRRNSKIFPAELEINVVHDPQGKLLAIVAIVRDVTEQLRAEDALRASEEQFRLTFENAKDAIFWADADTGVLLNCNKAAASLVERRREEIIGQNQTILHPKGKAEYYAEMFKRHIEQLGAVDDEAEVITGAGEVKLVHITATVTRLEGRHIIQGIFRDMTERLQMEENLRALNERYQAILTTDPDIIMEVNVDKVYTWANRAGLDFFGSKVVGQAAADFFVGEQTTYQRVEPLFRGSEEVIYVESWQRRQDGEKRLLAWWCRALKDRKGAVSGVLSTGRDITEYQQSKEDIRLKMEELKLVNNEMFGREQKMAGLEKEVDGLLKELGRPLKYKGG